MRYMIKILLMFMMFSLLVASGTLAADYPNRPVRLLTMVERHAQIDLLTRGLSQRLSDEFSKPFTVINQPGGFHGSVMARELQVASPDGYTLGVSATAAFTYAPHAIKTEYAFDDFIFISMLGLNQSGIVARPDRPWNTLKEAFEWARNENAPLTYMFQGVDDRDAMQRIAAAEGVDLLLMPSTGGPSIIQSVMGGHADLGHLGAILFQYVQDGRLKLLAATTPDRLTEIQEVPTLREQGWDEAVEMFVVLAAPKGVSASIVLRLENVMDKLARDDEFLAFITRDLKMEPVPFGREHAEKYMQKAYERFKR